MRDFQKLKSPRKYQGGWVLQAAGAIASIGGGLLGGNKAKKAAAREAAIEKRITDERVRDIGIEERSMRGETEAAAVSSGVVADKGSVLTTLADQASQFERERRVTKEVGASRVSAIMAQGKAVASQAKYGGFAQGLSYALDAVSSAEQYRKPAGSGTKPKGGVGPVP